MDDDKGAAAKRPARLDVQVGRLKFSGEGDQDWVEEQFQKTLEMMAAAGPAAAIEEPEALTSGGAPFSMSLASYIRSKGAEGNQTKRFLVTADWLRRRGQPLTTGAVAKALIENQQRRLANPADCLNKNVAKGHCEKNKDGFDITQEGLDSLG